MLCGQACGPAVTPPHPSGASPEPRQEPPALGEPATARRGQVVGKGWQEQPSWTTDLARRGWGSVVKNLHGLVICPQPSFVGWTHFMGPGN